jgi:23S rRNA pseudouridine2605 synthase
MSKLPDDSSDGDRLAKVIARSGLCSRRDAEGWIKDGRVTVNGKKVVTPAFNVSEKDKIKVDGEPLAARQGTRVWLYHKPNGLVVTEKDPEGRPTIFEILAEKGLPRVVSVGRLDINTEGLLLLTNDGGLKRVLELPATGWLRRYRVRAFGEVTQEQLNTLKDGIEIEGIQYGPIEAVLERVQGSNSWLVLALREGKNREVKNVLGALGLQVNRLIRVSYGPFQLGDLREGEVEVVPARVLRDQLGKRLAAEANADFDSEMPEMAAQRKKMVADPKLRVTAPGKGPGRASPRKDGGARFRFEDDLTDARAAEAAARPRAERPGRPDPRGPRQARPPAPDNRVSRTVFFDDGSSQEIKVRQGRDRDGDDRRGPGGPRGDRPDRGDRPERKFGDKPKSFGDKPRFGDKPGFGDKPRGPRPGGSDRPKRAYGDRPQGDRPPRDGADWPQRSFGDRPARGPRPEGNDRPSRPYGDRPQGARPARDGADRPLRSSRPYTPRNSGDDAGRGSAPRTGGARPPRDGGDRPARSFGDKPRSYGDKPAYAGKPAGAGRPSGGKPYGDKPAYAGKPYAGKPGGAARPAGGKPYAGKPGGAGRPAGGKPYAGKPGAARPAGGRPAGGKPYGDKPRGPRKPRS